MDAQKELLVYAKQLLYLRILEQDAQNLSTNEIDMCVLLSRDEDIKKVLGRN